MARDPICAMTVNEASALKITMGDNTHYFCSKHCLKTFAQQHNISEKQVAACLIQPKTGWYKNKTIIVASVLILFTVFSYIIPALVPFRESLLMYIHRIWWAILLGLFLGGVIDHFIPREYVSHILAKPAKRTIFYSVILG